MKKVLLPFLFFLPILTSAETVEIDGVWYNIITKGNVAEVTKNPSAEGCYSGFICIQEKITYNDNEYVVNKIGDNAFFGCNGLKSVTIPNSIISIGNSAFYNCENLEAISIPNSVSSIGDNVFQKCTSLLSIIIPNSLETISYDAFADCTGLKSVSIPNTITTIAVGAFARCTNLTNINIPTSLTTISGLAFEDCKSLNTLLIPNSVKTIGVYAFRGCTNLSSITISANAEKIDSKAFQNCQKLLHVYCRAENISDGSWGSQGLYTATDAFTDSYPEYITLHVPIGSVEAYRAIEPWSKFKAVVPLEDDDIPKTEKCAKPEISYENGSVKFTCETEGVDFISEVTVTDAKKYYDSELTLSQTYKITVYATKAGYENSDVATREIVIENGQSSLFGDLNKDGKVNVADHVKLSDIIMNK